MGSAYYQMDFKVAKKFKEDECLRDLKGWGIMLGFQITFKGILVGGVWCFKAFQSVSGRLHRFL